ncbi:unnamed protein product [Brassica napus]|uniref:(rape) hypothetical protein n=1 Tax=Brassica napus TaxID=3708 RepID=A0A816SQU8_BRANA|nr:unnamed protein product [Brassica napus]
MRPPPDCQPSVGALAPKGTRCSTALNYNYHRAVESLQMT